MAYLELWSPALAALEPGADQLFDHGPVFRLVSLGALGPPLTRQPPVAEWLEAQTALWRRQLDGIIWLDAPDEVLLERVRTRSQRHELEHLPPADAKRFLERYRAAYRDLVERMSGGADTEGPAVVRFDTASLSPEDMCDRLKETGILGP